MGVSAAGNVVTGGEEERVLCVGGRVFGQRKLGFCASGAGVLVKKKRN